MNPPFVYALAVSADGEWFAAGLGDTTVRIGRIADLGQATLSAQLPTQARLEGHSYVVSAVCVSNRAKRGCAARPGAVRRTLTSCWSLALSPLSRLMATFHWVRWRCRAFLGQGAHVVSGGADARVLVWARDAAEAPATPLTANQGGKVNAVFASHRSVVVASTDTALTMLDIRV